VRCHHFYGVLRGAASMGPDYELSAKFWGAGRSYKRVGALDD
jgi:hypothetical protein